MKEKLRNPEEFVLPYIPSSASLKKLKSKRWWAYRNISPIYMPAHVKAKEDQSKYYIKSPQEMSRYELADLERELREIEDPSSAQDTF